MNQSDYPDLLAPLDQRFVLFDESYSNSFCLLDAADRQRLVPDALHEFSGINDVFINGQASEHDESSQKVHPEESETHSKRADNTIFKTGLGEYRKAILELIKADPSLGWLHAEIKSIYGAKNLSIFPKLNIMVRQLSISDRVMLHWSRRSQDLLERKMELVKNGKYSKFRYEELERSISAMNLVMNEESFDKGFQLYWGKFKQQSRYAKSKEEVKNFHQYFKRLVEGLLIHGKIGPVTGRKESETAQE